MDRKTSLLKNHVLTLTDIAIIRDLINTLVSQETRISRYLALFFSVGDTVAFDVRCDTVTGIVVRVNQVSVKVSVPDDSSGSMLWTVPAGKLRFLKKVGKADFSPIEIAPPVYDSSVNEDSRR